jgi:phosphinothricin acetyltransferase
MSIRLATRGDAASVAAIYAPFCEHTPTSFEMVAPSADEMAGRIERITARYPWLVFEDGGQVVGYAYASQHRDRAAYQWAVDVTVYVAAGRRRGGVGRALYTALIGLLRLQGFFKAFGGITLPNPGSVGLHEALGFKPLGVYRGVGYKLGAWHDVAWYALALQPERSNPPAPRPIGEFLDSPGWHDAISRGAQHAKRAPPAGHG